MKDFAYYFTIFTLEGHKTHRAFLGGTKDSFFNQVEALSKAKVKTKETYRIDRLTGEMTLVEDKVPVAV